MQQRENTLAQVRTPTEETPPVHQSKVAAVIVDQSEEIPPVVAQERQQQPQRQPSPQIYRQLDSFSSLETFAGNPRFPRSVMKLQSEATTTTTTTAPAVHSTANLAAQALQIPALSESALLLLKTMRETANLDRNTQSPISDQHQSSDSDGLPSTVYRYGTECPSGAVPHNNGPDMDREEKVKILRALYAKRTRNKVSSSDISDEAREEDSNEEHQQRGEATSEEKQQQQQQKPVSDSQVATLLTHGNNTVKPITTPVEEGANSCSSNLPTILPASSSLDHSHKRKISSLDPHEDRTDKRFKLSNSTSDASMCEFVSRCA